MTDDNAHAEGQPTPSPATHAPAAAPAAAALRETHPDLFTVDEAAAYLKLPNARAFNRRRRQHGFKGERFGTVWMYSRGQLDALKKVIFGEDFLERRRRGRQ